MGSKGRIPPPHLRRPLPGPGMVHPDPFGPGIRPMPGAFPPYDMLPPPEIMEQKLAAQHVEMQRLATENQRLAATHGTLRQELAAAQHELQILHAQIGAVKSEREQQMRGLTDKISKMETELKAAEPVSSEVQKARADAQKLNVERQELISKVQQLSQDLQRAHADVQHVPALMSELESYRREYHHCRVTYDYEKKLYNDHLESLQVMEKNYITMATEMEKLRAELTNVANVDRTGGAYSGTTGNTESEAAHPVGQNAYGDGYNVSQGRGPFPAGAGAGVVAVSGAAAAAVAASAAAAYVSAQTAPAARPGYDAPRGPGYDAPKGPGFDASRGLVYDAQRGGPGYDAQRAAAYDAQRGPAYDALKGPSYDPQRVSRYDTQRGPGYDMQRGSGCDASRLNYDAAFKGVTGPHGQVASANTVPFGSGTPPASAGSGYEVPPQPQAGNPVRR